MSREETIKGLQYTIEMFLFDPATGNSKDPDDLNEADRITYDACMSAIALLKESESIVRCKDCKRYLECDYSLENGDDWFCADGERR